MPQTTRWSVQCRLSQPPAVRRAAAVLAGLAAGSVALGLTASLAGSGAVAVVVFGAALAYRLHRPPPEVELAADASGRWALRAYEVGARPWHPVTPARIWRGPCWMTVQFVATGPGHTPPQQPQSPILTVWRNAVAPDVWRKLAALLRARPADAPIAPATVRSATVGSTT